MKKLLLTGFEPFGNNPYNPTQNYISTFNKDKIKNWQVELVILPVSYVKVHHFFNELKKFDLRIHLGLASKNKKITIEKFAKNFCSSSEKDNDGVDKLNSIIQTGESKEIVKESLFCEELAKLSNLNINLSLDAGGYVCNYTFYKSLSIDKNAYFIHLPSNEKTSKDYLFTESQAYSSLDLLIMRICSLFDDN